MRIHRDAVTEAQPAVFIGVNGLEQKRDQRGLKLVRGLVNADDVFIISLQSRRGLLLESFNSHTAG